MSNFKHFDFLRPNSTLGVPKVTEKENIFIVWKNSIVPISFSTSYSDMPFYDFIIKSCGKQTKLWGSSYDRSFVYDLYIVVEFMQTSKCQ